MTWRIHTPWRTALAPCVLVAGLTACSDHPAEVHEEHGGHGEEHAEGVVELSPAMLERVTIRTAPVSTRVLPAELLTTGQVDFEQDRVAHVTPRIPGRVEAVHADLGDRIERGQALAVIDSIELGQAKTAYLQARAQEELARQNFEREQRLFGERVSSEKEMLAAKAAHLEAVARLRNGEETLRLYGLTNQRIERLDAEEDKISLLPVRSPLAGRVVEKHVTVGELVTPERNMFTIADLGHVWIWIDVYERDLPNVHLEDDVTVVVEALAGEHFGGKVSYISQQVDAATRTARARIDVENPEHKLRPGMFTRITLSDPHIASGELKPSLVVPEAAIQRDGTESIVFVPLANHRFERREVTVGRKAAGHAEILSGLDAGETIVVEGAFVLKSEASKERMGGGHSH